MSSQQSTPDVTWQQRHSFSSTNSTETRYHDAQSDLRPHINTSWHTWTYQSIFMCLREETVRKYVSEQINTTRYLYSTKHDPKCPFADFQFHSILIFKVSLFLIYKCRRAWKIMNKFHYYNNVFLSGEAAGQHEGETRQTFMSPCQVLMMVFKIKVLINESCSWTVWSRNMFCVSFKDKTLYIFSKQPESLQVLSVLNNRRLNTPNDKIFSHEQNKLSEGWE